LHSFLPQNKRDAKPRNRRDRSAMCRNMTGDALDPGI
jgi:hypothetical protein